MAESVRDRRLLFWNVRRSDLTHLVIPLAGSTAADVVVLNEPPKGGETLAALKQKIDDAFFEPPAGTADRPVRFRCYSRDRTLGLEEKHRFSRMSVRRFTLGGDQLLLALVHGVDPRNYDTEARQSFAQELADDLRFASEEQQTSRAFVVGDFNMNPYDRGMNLAAGLNAMMTRKCVQRGTRGASGKHRDLFYNPMWSLFGDDTPGPAGTVWGGSARGPYGWSMFDQVLVHWSLVRRFREVRILTKAGDTSLTTAWSGRPDRDAASDHFPILVTLSERDLDD